MKIVRRCDHCSNRWTEIAGPDGGVTDLRFEVTSRHAGTLQSVRACNPACALAMMMEISVEWMRDRASKRLDQEALPGYLEGLGVEAQKWAAEVGKACKDLDVGSGEY